ncbi:hypothetical protein Tco_0833379 [Tanacetum coccineum]
MPLSIKTQNDSFHFEHELKMEMLEDYEYVKSLEKEVDELESEKADFSNIYDLLLEEGVSKDVTFMIAFLDLKAQMQDKNIAISELKKLIEKCKGKSMETQFDKPFVVRQPNAQRIPKPSVLGKPTPFSNSPKMRRVNHTTSVSKPQLKSYQVKDKVVPNNSQLKFTKKEVEDHHRIFSISKKTEFVLSHLYLNDVNVRTKKPKVVPISASKPKRKVNKSVATPYKKTVASDTTIQKPKSYFKELYENTNKAWKWWIENKCPSEYKWKQMTPSRPSLKWKPTGRIFSNVRLRWIPTAKLLNSCTGKVESEPTHGSNVDIPHIHACEQTLGLSAGTSFNGQKQQTIDLNADALYNVKQENLRV